MGFLGGMINKIGSDNKQKQDTVNYAPIGKSQQGGLLSGVFGGSRDPNITNTTSSSVSNQPNTNQPINTQNQQHGFNGIIPMVQNYYSNHQAKVQDASAQPHINSLSDPNISPEQRQYHVNNLQQIYANRPDVLQQMGLRVNNAPSVPYIGATAVQPAGGK